jgi:hypothetical protein
MMNLITWVAESKMQGSSPQILHGLIYVKGEGTMVGPCILHVSQLDGIGDGNHNLKSSRHHDERY